MYQTFKIYIPSTTVGLGSVNSVGEVAKDFGAARALIVTDRGVVEAGLIEKVKTSLKNSGIEFDVFEDCMPNAPTSVIERCRQKVINGGYDLLIGIGGGSVLDITKVVSAIALEGLKVQDIFDQTRVIKKVLPKILIPTTSGTGSEWSRLAVVSDEAAGQKKGANNQAFYASAVIVDPEMTLGLSQKITADTGMDALTHAIEAYLTKKANPIGDMFAETAIRMVSDNLRPAYAQGSNTEARYSLSIAASLAIEGLQLQGAGLTHAIDGFIVSKAHISHGEALSILLPHCMKFNLVAAPERFVKIAELMGEKTDGLVSLDAAEKSIEAVRKLSKAIGMKQTLRSVGITASDIPPIVDYVFEFWAQSIVANNRRVVGKEDVAQILNAAL
jgi:alcohol dehydrogenase class IV